MKQLQQHYTKELSDALEKLEQSYHCKRNEAFEKLVYCMVVDIVHCMVLLARFSVNALGDIIRESIAGYNETTIIHVLSLHYFLWNQ